MPRPDNPSNRVAEAGRAHRAAHPERNLTVEQAQREVRKANPALDRAYKDWARTSSRPAGEQAGGGRTTLGELTVAERARLARAIRNGAKPDAAKRLILSERGAS